MMSRYMGLELIEITVTRYPAGDEILKSVNDLWLHDMWLEEPDDIMIDLGDSVIFESDGWGFDFVFVGNSNNWSHVGGMEAEAAHMGLDTTLRDHLPSIIETFDFKDGDRQKRRVTVWKFESEKYDNNWYIFGILAIEKGGVRIGGEQKSDVD